MPDPEIVPISDEPTVATLAAPPVVRPAMHSAASMKARPPPVPITNSPNRMKVEITVADRPGRSPRSPLSNMNSRLTIISIVKPECDQRPGIAGPK